MFNSTKERRRKFYICDRKRCENCAKACKYTLDIEHARYPEYESFISADSGLFQREMIR